MPLLNPACAPRLHPTTPATFSRAEAAALLELYILDAYDEEVSH